MVVGMGVLDNSDSCITCGERRRARRQPPDDYPPHKKTGVFLLLGGGSSSWCWGRSMGFVSRQNCGWGGAQEGREACEALPSRGVPPPPHLYPHGQSRRRGYGVFLKNTLFFKKR